MAKEPLTTRLDADTKREVEDYADEHEIGQTEAARRLIRAGLAAEGHPVATTDGGEVGPLERLASPRTMAAALLLLAGGALAMLVAAEFAALGQLTYAGTGLLVSTVLIVSGTLLAWTGALAQLALAEPLRGLVLPTKTEAKA